MEPEQAKDLVESQGYRIETISYIPEGRGHWIFDITLEGGEEVIARFERHKEGKGVNQRIDGQYGGRLSLEREGSLCQLVRKAGLAAPQVKGLYFPVEGPKFLMVEKLPGKTWGEYIQHSGFSQQAFLQSLEYLGADLARVHAVKFDSYGDVMAENWVEPADITNFTKRLEGILQLKFQAEERKGSLSNKEFPKVRSYIQRELGALEAALEHHRPPILVLSDIHPANHLVDERGKPSGYPDLERSQAGVPPFEFFQIRFTMIPYFNREAAALAEEAFFNGYQKAGGTFNREDPTNKKLDKLLAVGQVLNCVTTYHCVKDGIRDEWSPRFKEILFEIIDGKEIDYVAISDIFRSKTGQPKEPRLP